MEDGRFQVYTGKGKGKTTAALGLAFRAVGAGLHVFIGQFIKDMSYSEIKLIEERFPEICVEQFGCGKGCLVGRESTEADFDCARKGAARIKSALESGDYDIVIADEINVAHSLGLLTDEEVAAVIDARPESTELVFTGRKAAEWVMDRADLVTEMRCVKHYYDEGLLARVGIER